MFVRTVHMRISIDMIVGLIKGVNHKFRDSKIQSFVKCVTDSMSIRLAVYACS